MLNSHPPAMAPIVRNSFETTLELLEETIIKKVPRGYWIPAKELRETPLKAVGPAYGSGDNRSYPRKIR
jgi:hypothetical protein